MPSASLKTGAVVSGILEKGFDQLNEANLFSIVSTGNAAASLVIEGLGGIPSIPTKVQVSERLIKK